MAKFAVDEVAIFASTSNKSHQHLIGEDATILVVHEDWYEIMILGEKYGCLEECLRKKRPPPRVK